LKPAFLLAGLLLALSASASALEYRSTSRPAVLYDAPSTAAGKVAIAGSGLPLEVIVDTDQWVKVRDHSGRLAWVEKAALGGTRSVMVKAEVSLVRQHPRPDAEVVFRAAQGVLLDVTGAIDPFGWLPVKHAGGQTGWLPAHEAWGR
jgi:SH3-like domain-containing protein